MIPVASCEPGAVGLQLPEKEIVVTPRTFSAVIVKGPGPIAISWVHIRQRIVDI
jgi:hypothetical protein